MKLPNFADNGPIQFLINKMGATYRPGLLEISPPKKRRPIDTSEGEEVFLGQLAFGPGGLLLFQGKAVAVFIRDYKHSSWHDNGWRPKVHVTLCSTLGERAERRYVASANISGTYDINLVTDKQVVETITESLLICKNCLDSLGLAKTNSLASEFFDEQITQWLPINYRNEKITPYNIRPADWENISKRIREKYKYICQQCGLNFRTQKRKLHVHHKNQDKADNRLSNLVVLCVKCHSKQPGHGHLR